MEYPGNPALSEDIRQRIVSTFQQTLQSAKAGRHQEAMLGCDFILKLDQEFEPAKRLLSRLREATAKPAEPAGASADIETEMEALLAARRFGELLKLARDNQGQLAARPGLARLAEEAQAKLEAEPYVERFLASAREAIESGNRDEAARSLDKAASLDPRHPGLDPIRRAVEGFGPAAPSVTSTSFGLGLEESVETDPLAAAFEADSTIAVLGSRATAEEDPFAVVDAKPALDDLLADDPFALLGTPGRGEESSAGPAELEADPIALLGTLPGPDAELAHDDPFANVGLPQASGPAQDTRVEDLLRDGQDAFDRGDPQSAIDAWSRIFLIDIDNEEASRRIETARRAKAEGERQVEEILHEGMSSWERGDEESARSAFARVLEIQPGHAGARESLDQLASGVLPSATPLMARGPQGGAAEELAAAVGASELLEEILVPPEPGEAQRGSMRPRAESEPRAAAKGGRRFLTIGLLVLAAVGAVGFYVYTNRASLFPNAEPGTNVSEQDRNQISPIKRAETLYQQGKTTLAIGQLKRLPETSPFYAAAQDLLSKWELASKPSQPSLAPEQAARRLELLAIASAGVKAGEYLKVAAALAEAAALAPLDSGELAVLEDANQRTKPLATAQRYMAEEDWELALKTLWNLHKENPGNPDILRLIAGSYFNLGVRSLQRGDMPVAVKNFDEVLLLAPDDEDARKHRNFAETFASRPEDLFYRIYVKYIPTR